MRSIFKLAKKYSFISNITYKNRTKAEVKKKKKTFLNYPAGMHATTQQDYFFLFIFFSFLTALFVTHPPYLHRQSKMCH